MRELHVLVVEPDDDERRRIGEWLGREGVEVLLCPGPGRPGYTCPDGRGVGCPLAEEADVVVLDLRAPLDDDLVTMPAWQLLLYYYERAKRVVVLWGEGDAVRPFPDERVGVVPRPAERLALVTAVRAAARSVA